MEARGFFFLEVSNLNLNPDLYDSEIQTFKSYHAASMRRKKYHERVVLARNKCREDHSSRTLCIALARCLGTRGWVIVPVGSAHLWFL